MDFHNFTSLFYLTKKVYFLLPINKASDVHRTEEGALAFRQHERVAALLEHLSLLIGLDPNPFCFVISDNTYSIFDIETPRREIGYAPRHDAEDLMP